MFSKIEKECAKKVYFAPSYCSGEQTNNERHNALIRMFIPKRKNINDYSVEKIAWLENWHNTLPKKTLGYSTPDEVFNFHLQQVLST